MFRIITPKPLPFSRTSFDPAPSETMEDVLMDEDFEAGDDENGPSRARAVGGGRVTGPGEVIADAGRWMRGHGTYVQDEKVLASVAGTLERVNKLVSVRPLRTKYRPEVGDLVVGRIVEVGPKRWKVEAHAAQNAVLMLSSINLPGGVQRRKLESDELQMRTFFQEGDLLVAEVQAFFADGAMSLHTRSLKYGKLKNGLLVVVPPSLIVRLKSHFHTLPFGVDLIIGLNGYIWVSKTVAKPKKADGEEEGFGEESGEGVYSGVNEDISPSTRLSISRIAILLNLLAAHCIPISADIITEAYHVSVNLCGEDAEGVRSLARPEMGENVLRSLALGAAE
ncbi:exosome complex component RRP4 [Pseudohyphozyma bogoriensis]|nr:exosome complex component RRP4 [Pseudohyphozyma bogoriensis]